MNVNLSLSFQYRQHVQTSGSRDHEAKRKMILILTAELQINPT